MPEPGDGSPGLSGDSTPGPPGGPPGETWWQEFERFLTTPCLSDGPLWWTEPDRRLGYQGPPWIIRRPG